MKKPTFFKSGNVDPLEKKSFNHLKPDFINCIPTFIQQLKLHGLCKNEIGGAIILQIAHRVLSKTPQQQPEYTLINTANDFVTFLSKLQGEDVEQILCLLLDNLSKQESEILITFILKLEHMNSPDEYARGTSVAGKLIKLISDRSGVKFFNNYLIECVKKIETVIEKNPYKFAKYAYNLRNKQSGDELTDDEQNRLTKLLGTYLSVLYRHCPELPPLFQLVCEVINNLDFYNYKVKVAIVTDNIVTQTTPRTALTSGTYIVNYVEGSPFLYYLNFKREPTYITIDSIKDLDVAIDEKSIHKIEAALMPYHNDCLKRDRIIGIINTRFIGNMITARCQTVFNQESELGVVIMSTLNMLLIDSLHILATNRPTQDHYLKDFICSDNKTLLDKFYAEICYKPGILTDPDVAVDNDLLVAEQKIIYIALLVDIFKRFQGVCQSIKGDRDKVEKKSRIRIKKTNEERIQNIIVKSDDKAINIAKFCDLLNVLHHYRRKNRELPKVDGLYRETMELCLLYIFQTIVRPATSLFRHSNEQFISHIEALAPSGTSLLQILTLIRYIDKSDDVHIHLLVKIIKAETECVDGFSYNDFLNHTNKYLELFHPDFKLENQIEILTTSLKEQATISASEVVL
ncbi:MAG: hypothetical protein M3R00_01165 [Pseudomonadota bacterium]|nr:hypothetical protein [Pseudomonadota bacterium]